VFVLELDAPEPTVEEVRAHAEQYVARYALPRAVYVVEELPRSQIGKVMRRVVREQLIEGP